MCEVCRSTPCDSRCPRAPEPPAVYDCDWCGEGILHGEDYVEVEDRLYHKDGCFMEWLEDHGIDGIAALLDGRTGTARDQYYYYEE